MDRRVSLSTIRTAVSGFFRHHHLIIVWSVRRAINAVAYLLMILTILYFIFDVATAPPPPKLHGLPLSLHYIYGWAPFVWDMFTGQWGTIQVVSGVSYPTTTWVGYFLPYSLELGALALLLSLAVAYPMGLLSGWRQGKILDGTVRGYTATWLFVPAILLCLVLLTFLFEPYVKYTGDPNSLYGTLPSAMWFDTNMGATPSWIGQYGNTSPTGFPLVDAAWHGAWTVEWLVFLKVMLAALCIAASYVAVFLRYARNATVEATRSDFLRAGRSRGIPERSLLWHHTGRRVIPLYIFTIGNTFGALVVIQSAVEYIFNTQGALYLLLYQGGQTIVGGGLYTPPEQPLIIAVIFLISVAILVVNIVAETVAMALDPAWLSEREKGGT
jgi:ABC-type dipeptide/oligopeptide/nickel transport system permease component